jgi:dolichol-phosphate mannosyltransferase
MSEHERQPPAVWVVLPTYNEVGNIARMIETLASLDLNLRILVVDDASPDGTAEIASQMSRQYPDVHVICRTEERGLGTAYLAGFRYAIEAGAGAVLTMDSDFSHDPKTIPALIQALHCADVVIGSRYVPGSRIVNWSAYRRGLSAWANRFARRLFALPTHDCTSGFRLYRKEVLQAIPWHRVRSTGYSFLVETLYWATRQDPTRVKEVPICFVDRTEGQSKMGWREAFWGIVHLLRLGVELSRDQRPGAYR